MRILVLDDEPARHNLFAAAWGRHDIVQAWTADEAERALEGDRFDLVTLDHDLGPTSHQSGLYVARHIASMPESSRPAEVFIHSANPVGAQAMMDALVRVGIIVRRIDPLRLG